MGNNTVDDALDRQVRLSTAGLAASNAALALGRVLRGAQLRPDEIATLEGLAEGFSHEADRLDGTRPKTRRSDARYARSAHALAGASLYVKPNRQVAFLDQGVATRKSAIALFEFLGDTLRSVAKGSDYDPDEAMVVRQILRELSNEIETKLTTSGESPTFSD